MDKVKRARLMRAMDIIVSSINEEGIDDAWLMNGVADGFITEDTTDEEIFHEYCENDDQFADIMSCFVRTMGYMLNSDGFKKDSRKNGDGYLYCDEVVSEKNDRWLGV